MLQLTRGTVISIFSKVLRFVIFKALQKTRGIRLSNNEESKGIDAVEFGVASYNTFE